MLTKLQQEIVKTIRENVEGHTRLGIQDTTLAKIYLEGEDKPIVVMEDDVLLPPELKSMAPGIRLDVQTILAERKR